MSLSASIREQLLNSFRAELSEHYQTITQGLLAVEQGQLAGDGLRSHLEHIFRAAHSLKGASRAVGATMIEQLAHALESALDGLRCGRLETTPLLFNTIYRALDAVQAVQAAYEAGLTTPPSEALQALAELEAVMANAQPPAAVAAPAAPAAPAATAAPAASDALETTDALAEDDGAHGLAILCMDDIPAPNAFAAASVSARPAASLPPAAMPALLSPAGVPAPAPNGREVDETIRVSVSKLDALMSQVSELLIARLHADQHLAQITQLRDQLALWQKEWLLARPAYQRLLRRSDHNYLSPTDAAYAGATRRNEWGKGWRSTLRLEQDAINLIRFCGANQDHLRQLNATVNTLGREFANDTMQLALIIDELETDIKRVRMLPLRTIVDPLRRMVRDLAQAAGKEINFQIIGGDTELDKRILEQVKDPLIHLLRNAVDHGIESRHMRLAAGKPPVGEITLAAEQAGQDVIIHVADDGMGLDLDALRQVVARHSDDAAALNESELVQSIFSPGISTSPMITDISGRGVGLDVVRRNVTALQGQVQVDWKPGRGTSFSLVIPLTLTSSHGLLVRVSGELFVLPFNAIEGIYSVNPAKVYSLEGSDTVHLAGQPTRLVSLSSVLDLPENPAAYASKHIPVVVLTAAERRIAFAVDELAGEQEVVIKSLGKQLQHVLGIAGATVMGSGQVVLILNPIDLIKLTVRGKRHSLLDRLVQAEAATVQRAQRRILVVDDSITTRTLEKNILEAAGYAIELATDGQEAWERIVTNGKPDLIVSDIAMPRLNGFDLTHRIKQDPQTSHIPIILVTSLDSPEEKMRGIDAGADAYIIKSRFDQNTLLETIEQLI